ncbi:ABC transporter permease [Dongia deserti]|uniref:ABC transporter permease n=1 Tax=Dongia deserti TaxID=2268030 RepID=UPI0025478733|nr:ABC transporter permease [Dongia deserti]
MLRAYSALVYLFLYGPIALIVLFSFNSGLSAADFQGFSLRWYARVAGNSLMLDALRTSLTVAFSSAALATIMGTMAALALQRVKGPVRVIFDGLTYIAIMVPGIVIGIATLIALVTTFDAANAVLAEIWPTDTPPQLHMGYGSIIAAHTLFSMALVVVIVRARIAGMDRSLIEASMDLYADPWATFRQVTLPQLAPAILAGFLLCFTFSFDDFVIAFFVAGPLNTLPIYVFSSIRRGVTPEINAIGTAIMMFSLVMLFGAQLLLRRKSVQGKT